MSEALDYVRGVVAEFDRQHPHWRAEWESDKARTRERQQREIVEDRERREARKTREAEAKQQAATNSWDAIDQRIVQHIEQHFFSGKLGVGGAVIGGLTDAIGGVIGKLRKEFKESKHAIEEEQRSFEAKLAALEQRLASNNQAAWVSWVDSRIKATLAHERDVLIEATGGAQGRAQLRDEVKRAIEEMCSAFGAEIAALEERLKAMPGRLPVAKIWLRESVTYEGEVVSYDGASYQALRDTAQTPGGSDWVCVAARGIDGCDGRTPNARGMHI